MQNETVVVITYKNADLCFFYQKCHFTGNFAQNREMTNLSWIGAPKEILNDTMSLDRCPDWNGVWNHEIVSVSQLKSAWERITIYPQYLLYTLTTLGSYYMYER